jgi:hypothetical protein
MPAIFPVALRPSEDIMARVLCVLYDDPVEGNQAARFKKG